ncbi:hypothetical protein M378DRAFT_156014 [Amanita muscaria Koide BX008]|uniref:Uncharacterized protein n=1 Tax=Amanita muscaria (strain Koide BX008) TaxID=946122 RepID=A0A0C2X9M7_AMAMK|nr:hypothetical protein M378DRAFT_156014 [Amanita muscaria Koide BX008]
MMISRRRRRQVQLSKCSIRLTAEDNLTKSYSRNLFAIEFQERHGGQGTNSQFKAEWDTLTEEQRNRYTFLSKALTKEVRAATETLVQLITHPSMISRKLE